MRLLETVVVEGRDDMSAVLAAVEANVIITHGYGITQETLDTIRAAYDRNGIVVFTDPDHAGRRIRERLASLFPEAKHAYLSERQASKNGDTGVENASPEDILKALLSVGCRASDGLAEAFPGRGAENEEYPEVTIDDLAALGLTGQSGSAEKRASAGEALGIGSANAGAFLKRLRRLRIGLSELEKACGAADR